MNAIIENTFDAIARYYDFKVIDGNYEVTEWNPTKGDKITIVNGIDKVKTVLRDCCNERRKDSLLRADCNTELKKSTFNYISKASIEDLIRLFNDHGTQKISIKRLY